MLIPTFSKHTSNGLLIFVETLKNSLTNIGCDVWLTFAVR